MKHHFIFDTNVIVSALLHPARPVAKLVNALRNEELGQGLVAVFDHRILAEYEDVLRRPKFAGKIAEDDVRSVRGRIERFGFNAGTAVRPVVLLGSLPDEGDRLFVEVALATGAPLITGNRKHFPPQLGIEVMSPADVLRLLGL